MSFGDSQQQKIHMKTDWHRYNLKRRVTNLPPIDEDTFREKIEHLDSTSKGEPLSVKGEKKIKTKQKRKTQNNAGASKSESRDTIPSNLEDVQDLEFTEDDHLDRVLEEKRAQAVELSPKTCLFCSRKSAMNFSTVEENVAHMSKAHGLFIPEKRYLVNLEGLISYLGEKLGLGNVCLSCSYQGRNLDAVREHMHSKRHMRIPYETDAEKLEYSDFYDFTPSYSTTNQDANDQANSETLNDDNDDWEDISGDDNGSQDDISLSETEEDILLDIGGELILPSGLAIGHRATRKLRKPRAEVVLSEGQGTVVAAESRQFGLGSRFPITKVQQERWKAEKKMADLNDRRLAKYVNNQPYYRDQLLQ